MAKSWNGQSIIHPLSNEASFVISNMHCLNGKPISFMKLDERTHFVTAILCKVPHAVSDALIEEIVPNVAKATRLNCVFCSNGRGCPDHVGQDPMEGKDNPPDRLSRLLRSKGLDTGTEPVFQRSEVRAHCQSLHGPTSKVSNLWGYPLVRCMPEKERSELRSKGEVRQLRGRPPGVEQAMQKTKGDSTNPHRENTRASEAGRQTTKSPDSHRFSKHSQGSGEYEQRYQSPSRVTLQR